MSYKPQQMVRKPTTMTCMVWDGTDECVKDIIAWIAKEMSLTTSQVWNGVFFPSLDLVHECRLWCDKSQAHVVIRPGDAVVREPDRSGFYPIEKSVLEATYVGIPDDV